MIGIFKEVLLFILIGVLQPLKIPKGEGVHGVFRGSRSFSKFVKVFRGVFGVCRSFYGFLEVSRCFEGVVPSSRGPTRSSQHLFNFI